MSLFNVVDYSHSMVYYGNKGEQKTFEVRQKVANEACIQVRSCKVGEYLGENRQVGMDRSKN